MPFGWDIYLRAHEIGTHSIAGTLVCGLLTAAIVRTVARRSAYRELAAAASIGAMSHALLDLASSARLRPAWPVVDAIASLPLVAMADPWLFALCIFGPVAIWHARQRLRTGGLISSPAIERRRARHALAAIAVFLMVKAGLGAAAIAHYERTARTADAPPVIATVIEAQWASLVAWHVYDRTPAALRAWRTNAGGAVEQTLAWPIEPESSSVAASRGLATVRNFLRAHELGFAVTGSQRHDRIAVMWSDIRFCWSRPVADATLSADAVMPRLSTGPIACALWFGGELAGDGTPVRQIVRIGSVTQTRDPSR
jgi:membrane-bound metal-dependent hydrolase YbcI (DUF457 family)